ncbi:uroporphyrinogen decarboxylase family protein [Methanosalsum natronophilum]|nr:uroporphyrinogen decarboxylase family protein [Methanosalsum natronophilum]MCS3924822.1 uroporphyrinogen decarboxylase [Methanosalsum natronophilum]
MEDIFTSKERFINALKGDEVDRTPFGYLWFGAGNNVLYNMGKSLGQVYRSASDIAEAQILAREMYHHDNVMSPWGCLLVEAEALGNKLVIKNDGYPNVSHHAIKSSKQFDMIDPEEIKSSNRVETISDSIEILSKEVGDETFICGSMLSPLMLADQLIEGPQMYFDMLQDVDNFKLLLDRVTESCIYFSEVMLEAGADGIFVENGGSTSDLFSHGMAKEFGNKYTKKLYSNIQKNKGYVISHNCALNAFHDLEADLKPDAINFAFGETSTLKRKYGVKCDVLHNHKNLGCQQRYCFSNMKEIMDAGTCLMGNINPGVFFSDTEENISFEVHSCLENAPKTGFILSTGCEIPLNTPLEKMEIFWKSVTKNGA